MGDRSSLNTSIQSFSLKKLKKTQTNDRSAPIVANNNRDRSNSESSVQIPSGRPKLTTRVSGPISPTNRANDSQQTPANDQGVSPMGFRLPMQLPDRSTLRHVDVSHKIKNEEKSPPWVRNTTDTNGTKPELHPRATSNETLLVPAVKSIRNLPKTPPSSPVSRDVSPPPPLVPSRGRQGSVVKIPVPQNPNVMLGTPTSPPVMQSTVTADNSHVQVSSQPPPVPRRIPFGQQKSVQVIEAQAPSSPEVSRVAKHANAPVDHSNVSSTSLSPTQQPVIVHHVTVHSPPFSHDPMMRRLGYGQEKQEAPKTIAAPGPATMELPPNNSRVYQVNWRVQPEYNTNQQQQQAAPVSRPLPVPRKMSLEDIKVNQPSPIQTVSVRDRSATLPRFRAPLNPPQTIPTINIQQPSSNPMSDYESRWNFHHVEEFPAPPAFRAVQKIYPSGSQTGNSYPAPALQHDDTVARHSTSPVVPTVNSNPTIPTSPSTVGGGKKAPPPRPPKKGTGSLTLSQVPSTEGGEQPLVSPVSPGERKSLPAVPGTEKKLPPPLPKKQPNMVFHPPNNPPPNPGGPKKVAVPVTAPPKKVGTAPVPPKKMVTGSQAPPPPPPKKVRYVNECWRALAKEASPLKRIGKPSDIVCLGESGETAGSSARILELTVVS